MSTDLSAFVMVVFVLSIKPPLNCIIEYAVALRHTNH